MSLPASADTSAAQSGNAATAGRSSSDAQAREGLRPSMRYPLVFGHRGAAGYRPEHTLAGYQLAAEMGADYIEPDLVSTKDHVLIDRHENDITETTDVADHPEFAARKTTKVVDGVSHTGWFTEDFTLVEIKTLRAKERLPDVRQHNTMYDGRYRIPTLQEVIDVARREGAKRGRVVGVIPETKHPTYFDSIGLSLEEPLVKTLRRNFLAGANAPAIVQSFETSNLKELNGEIDVPLVQLIGSSGAPYDLVVKGDPRTYADLTTAKGLRQIARYADVIGPDKSLVISVNEDKTLGAPTGLVQRAHRAHLTVTPYTFRNENTFLPANFQIGTNPSDYGNAFGEYRAYFRAGIDGLFSDNSDTAVEARDDWLDSTRREARAS